MKKRLGNEDLLSRLIDTTTYAVINTEMATIVVELDKYRKCISRRMLAMDDATLTELANLNKFSEAFIKGWNVWKRGTEEEAFQTFCSIMTVKEDKTLLCG